MAINQPMFKKYSITAFFILLTSGAVAQVIPDSNYINVDTIKTAVNIDNKTLLFFDSNNVATLENITQQIFFPLINFDYKKSIKTHLVPKKAYLQIALFNTGTTPDTILLLPGATFDELTFYERTPTNTLQFVGDGSEEGLCKFIVPAGQKKIFISKLTFSHHGYNFLRPRLIQNAYFKTYKTMYYYSWETLRTIGFIMSGMLFMMMVFIVVNYVLSGKKEFLYYLGYILSVFLLILLLALLYNVWGSAAGFLNGYLDLVLLIIGNVFYLAFTRHFLDTKENYITLDKAFRITELFLIFLLIVFSFIHYFTPWYFIEAFLETFMKIIVLGIGILFIVIAFKQKKRLIIYLAIGSAFAIFFSCISLAIILLRIPTKNAVVYYEIGLIFALSFFLLGLTYKNRNELIERIKEQEALKLDVEKKDFESQIAIIKAQQEERNRISADMHDDLGAGMTTIRLYSELAKNKIGNTPIPEIEKISSSANELLNKMNAIIWSMSSSNDSLGNMVAYIRSYSLEYFEDTGVECNIIIPENLPNIVVGGEIRRNVFLVIKEALNNVLKHSGATKVTINLQHVAGGLKLLIQDNGKGIDFEKLRQFGNGLKNMQKRMEDIGVDFKIENSNGTLITLYRSIEDF